MNPLVENLIIQVIIGIHGLCEQIFFTKNILKKYNDACTASDHRELERKYGVRYSELLRLPYFDIVEQHVIDPMYNLSLGTGKYLMKLWKERGILTEENFETIQMTCRFLLERIPHKISSNFSGFTADQGKNWICIYSMVCLKNILPVEQYECWSHFQDACFLFLQPQYHSMI